MKRILVFISVISFGILSIHAQIQVYSNNNVGVGSPSANGKFVVSTAGASSYNATISTPTTGTALNGTLLINSSSNISNPFYGLVSCPTWNTNGDNTMTGIYGYVIKSTASSSGVATGVLGMAGNASSNYGVTGWLYGTNNGAAVYGSTTTTNVALGDRYAGYFNGKVHVTGYFWASSGTITGSDERIKKDISELDSADAIFALKPVKYHLKNEAERKKLFSKNTMQTASVASQSDTAEVVAPAQAVNSTSQKKHYGFLAQDLQKVYPDLVYESAEGMLGIDYQGLIPIIVEQLKKMKESIDAKDARIEALEQEVLKLKKAKQ